MDSLDNIKVGINGHERYSATLLKLFHIITRLTQNLI